MAPKDKCLTRASRRPKTASANIFLMAELGEARLQCDQLLRYLNDAVELINKSEKKDHFFEVAGHLINETPRTAFKLQKALDAVAFAAARIDSKEIEQGMQPEKVEDLERVLKDVRIQQVQPSSLGDDMTPKQASAKIREIVKTAKEEGSVSTLELAKLAHALDPKPVVKMASAEVSLETRLEKLAAVLEAPLAEGQKHSRSKLATVLRGLMAESELKAITKLASQKEAFTDNTLSSLFDQIRGFAIAGSRAANTNRWRPALLNMYYTVDTIGTILVRLGSTDTSKSEGLKREIRQEIAKASQIDGDAGTVTARHEKGVPASPEDDMSPEDAAKWKEMNELHGDNFKAACESEDGKMGCDSDESKMSKFEEGVEADPTSNMSEADAKSWKIQNLKNRDNFKESCDTPQSAEEAAKRSRFEQGQPADPTQMMTPQDAEEWKDNTDEHGDKFKKDKDAYDFSGGM